MLGFDYGTSNCAVGVMDNNKPKIIPLSANGGYLPSTLYAPNRDMIVNWLYERLPNAHQSEFKKLRSMQLQKGSAALRELALDDIPKELYFGHEALTRYLEEPEEGYYIKSPKSFLGASGLHTTQIQLFEDIVAAMMQNVKSQTEKRLEKSIDSVVIGRPINFQGLKGEESNKQAIEVLTKAAKRIGFKDIEFQFEPVAAGFEFETTLANETKVLVVDIGGGTTDCSMLLMGPEYVNQLDRQQHLLAHSGVRIGGNDFDIQLAYRGIMPKLGSESLLKSGKHVPVNSFRQAVAINNINEQTEFYSPANRRFLEQLTRDVQQPELLERLLTVHDNKLSYRLVNGAEQAKIRLTDSNDTNIELNDIAKDLNCQVSRELMLLSAKAELNQIAKLMQEAVDESSTQPDVIFVTGGTAKSPVLNHFLQQQFPGTKIVIGDHFGSVTAGLTRWADRIFS